MRIEKLSDFDHIEQVTRDNIWPLPKQGEKDILVEFCIERIRSAVRRKSKDTDIDSIRKFFDEVLELRNLSEACQTQEDVLELAERMNQNEFANATHRFIDPDSLTEENRKRRHFGMTKEEIAEYEAKKNLYMLPLRPTRYRLGENSLYYLDEWDNVKRLEIAEGCNEIDTKRWYEEGENFALISDGKIVKFHATQKDYDTELEKLTEVKSKNKRKRSKSIRVRVPPLENYQRYGISYDIGNDVDEDRVADTFGFTESDIGYTRTIRSFKKTILTYYLAFSDLCFALGIDTKDISGNKLNVSLGSQGWGQGKSSYNIEKSQLHVSRGERGAGAVAEAWFHALDHRLAVLNGLYGKYYSSEKGNLESLNALIDYLNEYEVFYSSKLRNDAVILDRYEKRENPYWEDIPNLLSRAFTTYIIDKLAEFGYRNDYLAYSFDDVEINGKMVSLYPKGKDREKFKELFDNFFEELKEKGVLHELRIHDLYVKK